MIFRRWVFIATLLLGAAAWPESPRPLVVLTFTGDEATRATFTGSLSELLMRIDIDLRVATTDAPPPKDRLLAVVSADWSSPTTVTINVSDAEEKTVLVRRLSRAAPASVVLEAATHIIQSVIEELAHPTVILSPPPSVTATVAPPPVVVFKPAPPPVLESGLAFAISGYAGARGYGSTGPALTPGGGLELSLTMAGGRWRPSVWISGEYQAPFEYRAALFAMNVQAIPFRAGIGITAFAGTSWRLDANLGGGMDLFLTSTSGDTLPANRLKHPQPTATGIITARLAFHVAVARSADVWLAPMLDVDVDPLKWVTQMGPTRQQRVAVYEPWRFRPGVQLGFSFAALGADPYLARLGKSP